MPRSPAVRCCDCSFAWNSSTMAEGLRLLGSCPKCGGALDFAGSADAAADSAAPRRTRTPPHLVLGIPRR